MPDYITERWKAQGVVLKEIGDHELELLKDGQVVARFSQTGVRIENLVQEIKSGKYN